jgi:hypothetical protein
MERADDRQTGGSSAQRIVVAHFAGEVKLRAGGDGVG